jgi:hypothetical protein
MVIEIPDELKGVGEAVRAMVRQVEGGETKIAERKEQSIEPTVLVFVPA